MKRMRGFTLIELMIVVAIVAILAAVAITAYNKQIRKSRRAEAKQGISDVSLREEKWRAAHPKYLGTDSSVANKATFGAVPISTYYTIAITTAESGTDFTITAAPRTADQTKDSCGTFSFQSASGVVSKCPGTDAACATHTPTDCW